MRYCLVTTSLHNFENCTLQRLNRTPGIRAFLFVLPSALCIPYLIGGSPEPVCLFRAMASMVPGHYVCCEVSLWLARYAQVCQAMAFGHRSHLLLPSSRCLRKESQQVPKEISSLHFDFDPRSGSKRSLLSTSLRPDWSVTAHRAGQGQGPHMPRTIQRRQQSCLSPWDWCLRWN